MPLSDSDGRLPLVARGVGYEVDAARLLDQVDMEAERGELIGLVGANGAGKTTLLKALSGLLRRAGGTVVLEGRDLDGMSPGEVARVVAHLPQFAPYTFGFTALEVVLMGRYPHMGRFQVEGERDRRIAREAMRVTETESFAGRAVTTLSGGERQRVLIARALAQEPRILLLDEPTANLDLQHQLKVLEMVKEMVTGGLTAVAAIHDLALAARYCDRLVLLKEGRLQAEGRPEEVLTSANLEAAFGVRAVTYRDPLTGSLTLSLLDSAPAQAPPRTGARAHVVCGGGSGARLMYELQRGGFTVTAGALGSGDTDRTAADILGIEYVPVAAFGSIDDGAHARHVALVKEAEVVVLCDMPVGANNLRNVEALRTAGRVLCVGARPLAERDFTGGAAQRIFESLKDVAWCDDPAEVARMAEALLKQPQESRKGRRR